MVIVVIAAAAAAAASKLLAHFGPRSRESYSKRFIDLFWRVCLRAVSDVALQYSASVPALDTEGIWKLSECVQVFARSKR
jgi:hypothetical protein